jgi:hypothetical protein
MFLGMCKTSYTPSGLTATTWYRVKYTSSGCSGIIIRLLFPFTSRVQHLLNDTSGQSVCKDSSYGPVSVSAYGSSLTYQWVY